MVNHLQLSMALSTTEAKFIAASDVTKELLWLKSLLGELIGKGSEVPPLYVNNASAVKLMKNPGFLKHLKHVEVRYYFVCECYQDGHKGVEHIDGVKQLADLFTKLLD
jgi:hypothetical protein